MNSNINLESEDFKIKLINTINKSDLPISLIYYILKDIFHDFENSYFKMLNKIQEQQQQNQQQGKED